MALGVGVTIALGLPSLTFPFGPDQGMTAAFARRMAEGAVPYRDVWDNRSPLPYLVTWIGYEAGLRDMALPRGVDLFWQAATALAIAIAGRRLFGPAAGAVAAALYGYSYFGQADYWHTAQPDGFPSLFLAAGVAVLAASPRAPTVIGASGAPSPSWRAAAAAGALGGLAFLSKYPAIAGVLPLAFLVVRGGSPGRIPARLGALAAGAAVPVLAWLAFCGATGAIEAFVVDTVHYNAGHARIGAEIGDFGLQLRETVALLLGRRDVLAPLLLLPLVAVGHGGWVCAAWVAAALAMYFSQGKYHAAHLLPLIAPLSLLSAAGLWGLWRRIAEDGSASVARKVRWAAIILLALGAGWRTAATWAMSAGAAVAAVRDDAARRAFHERHRAPYGFALADDLDVAAFLAERAGPGDCLQVWGFQPMLYFLSGVPPCSRFLSHHPLVNPHRSRDYDLQFQGDLAARPPAFVVVNRGDPMPWLTGTPLTSAELLPLHEPLAREVAAMEVALETPTLVAYRRP